jgi:hypothetical protein
MGDGEALVQALERGRHPDTFSIADMRSMLAFSTPRVVAHLGPMPGGRSTGPFPREPARPGAGAGTRTGEGVVDRRGFPFCGACRRRLQKADQWRCPYTTCRRWLRGTSDDAREVLG